MTGKQQLLDAEDRAWRELSARLGALAPEEWEKRGVNGEYSAKDVLAHIAAWHAKATDSLEILRSTGRLSPAIDVDAFNATQYEQCKDLSLHDVRVMSGAARHRFREEVAQLADPLDVRVARLVASNAHEHYEEHIPQLDAFVGRR